MKMRFNVLLVVLVLLLSFFACSSDDETIQVVTTDLVLPEGAVLKADLEHEKVYVISSYDDLTKHIEIKEGVDFPKINFKQETILLISGVSNYGIESKSYAFFEDDKNYTLDVNIKRTAATVMENWCFVIKVARSLDKDITVEANVKYS